jgi:drug/metabolite transporter (DMT)-like permease
MSKTWKSKMTRSLGVLFLLGLIWGSGYSIARYAMINGVSPAGYTFWQSLGPALVLSVLSWKYLKFDKTHIKFYFSCGLIGIAIPNTNMYFASPHLPAGVLALIVNIVPVILYPLALIAGQEKFRWSRCIGVTIAVAGVLCLILPKSAIAGFQGIHWILMGLITPLCFAFFALFINPFRPRDSNPVSLAAGMLIAATFLLIPWVISMHAFYMPHWPLTAPDKVILIEIILSSAGYVLFFYLLRIAGPVYYSLVDGIVALTGLGWGIMIFHETFHVWTMAAIVLILSGIFLVTMNAANPPAVESRSGQE